MKNLNVNLSAFVDHCGCLRPQARERVKRYIEEIILEPLRKSAEKQGRKDLWATYLEARNSFLAFQRQGKYEQALDIIGRYS